MKRAASVNRLRAFVASKRAKDSHTIETWNRMIDAEQELAQRAPKKRNEKD